MPLLTNNQTLRIYQSVYGFKVFFLDGVKYNISLMAVLLCIMFATNGLVFVLVTSVQQFVAVYFPFNLKVWVTTRRTRIIVAAVYGCSVMYHACMFVIIKCVAWEGDVFQYVIKAVITLITVFMVSMQTAVFGKFVTRVCCTRGTRNTLENSRTHGNNHSRKTTVISLALSGGATVTMISSFLNNDPQYLEIVLTMMSVQWIVTALVYIGLNWNVLVANRYCKSGCCCCGKTLQN